MAVKITRLKGSAFLSFPKMSAMLLSEMQERFSFDTKNVKYFSDILYFEDYSFEDGGASFEEATVSLPKNATSFEEATSALTVGATSFEGEVNSSTKGAQSFEETTVSLPKSAPSFEGATISLPKGITSLPTAATSSPTATPSSPNHPVIPKENPYWSKCTFASPYILKFDSIGEAAGELKKIQRSWAPYFFTCFRRGQLIQEKLPYVNLKNRNFPFEYPDSPIGIYTLLDEKTILFSPKTFSSLPAGNICFNEDHVNPPSRAYLKIQESLAQAHHFFKMPYPDQTSRSFEAGACPGGWTWVLVNLGSKVFAVDRSPLADSLMQNPKVTFLAHDAFTLTPEEVGECDWVFSDVICYPDRLYEWCCKWLESGKTKKMICTIKMQGKIDWPLVEKFASIPDSLVLHLNYNKHELTWIHVGK